MKISERRAAMKLSEVMKNTLQEKIDQKLQNAISAVDELRQIVVDHPGETNTDPEDFSKLIDRMHDLRPKVN